MGRRGETNLTAPLSAPIEGLLRCSWDSFEVKGFRDLGGKVLGFVVSHQHGRCIETMRGVLQAELAYTLVFGILFSLVIIISLFTEHHCHIAGSTSATTPRAFSLMLLLVHCYCCSSTTTNSITSSSTSTTNTPANTNAKTNATIVLDADAWAASTCFDGP